jgi:hypothetical protein
VKVQKTPEENEISGLDGIHLHKMNINIYSVRIDDSSSLHDTYLVDKSVLTFPLASALSR